MLITELKLRKMINLLLKESEDVENSEKLFTFLVKELREMMKYSSSSDDQILEKIDEIENVRKTLGKKNDFSFYSFGVEKVIRIAHDLREKVYDMNLENCQTEEEVKDLYETLNNETKNQFGPMDLINDWKKISIAKKQNNMSDNKFSGFPRSKERSLDDLSNSEIDHLQKGAEKYREKLSELVEMMKDQSFDENKLYAKFLYLQKIHNYFHLELLKIPYLWAELKIFRIANDLRKNVYNNLGNFESEQEALDAYEYLSDETKNQFGPIMITNDWKKLMKKKEGNISNGNINSSSFSGAGNTSNSGLGNSGFSGGENDLGQNEKNNTENNIDKSNSPSSKPKVRKAGETTYLSYAMLYILKQLWNFNKNIQESLKISNDSSNPSCNSKNIFEWSNFDNTDADLKKMKVEGVLYRQDGKSVSSGPTSVSAKLYTKKYGEMILRIRNNNIRLLRSAYADEQNPNEYFMIFEKNLSSSEYASIIDLYNDIFSPTAFPATKDPTRGAHYWQIKNWETTHQNNSLPSIHIDIYNAINNGRAIKLINDDGINPIQNGND